jgi:phenylpropionate dioxygenase-like ring-hydroxylating dioxygenase large terminal subunit
LKDVPKKARARAYAVEEKYGHVWVYPDEVALDPVFEPDALKGKRIAHLHMAPLKRVTHPHVPMLNGIDAQHVMGVHGVSAVPEVSIREHSKTRLEVYLKTNIPGTTWIGRAMRFVLGPTYAYSNVFVDGTVALLNSVKDVRLFNRFHSPECYVVFSLMFRQRGYTEIIPVAVTERRPGLWGGLITWFMLRLTKLGYDVLKAQEGEAFFKGMRFRADGLLPGYDGAIGTLIAFTNRQALSVWSRMGAAPLFAPQDDVTDAQREETDIFNSPTHGEERCELRN